MTDVILYRDGYDFKLRKLAGGGGNISLNQRRGWSPTICDDLGRAFGDSRLPGISDADYIYQAASGVLIRNLHKDADGNYLATYLRESPLFLLHLGSSWSLDFLKNCRRFNWAQRDSRLVYGGTTLVSAAMAVATPQGLIAHKFQTSESPPEIEAKATVSSAWRKQMMRAPRARLSADIETAAPAPTTSRGGAFPPIGNPVRWERAETIEVSMDEMEWEDDEPDS